MEAIVSPNFSTKARLFLLTPKSNQLIRKGPIFLHFPLQKPRRRRLENPVLCTTYASPVTSPSSYGGWEELEPLDDSMIWDELEPVRRFMVSIGIRDGKSAILFCLGFLSALAISRVRFSTMVILPVSILVFAAGLSVGITQSGLIVGSLEKNGRRYRDSKFFDERLKVFIGFMDDLDTKTVELKGGLEKIVNFDGVETSEIRRYLAVVESLRLAALPAKKAVENFVETNDLSDGAEGFDMELGRKSNQKSSKRRKDTSMVSFDFLQYIVGFFQENRIASKAAKIKGSAKSEVPEKLNSLEGNKESNATCDDNLVDKERERTSNVAPKNKVGNFQVDDLPEESFDRKLENTEELSECLRGIKQYMINGVKLEEEEEEIPSSISKINGNHSYYHHDDYNDKFTRFSEVQGNINRSLNVGSRQRNLEATILQHRRHKREIQKPRNNLQEKDSGGVEVKSMDKVHASEFESAVRLQSMIDIRSRIKWHDERCQDKQVRCGFTPNEDIASDDRNIHDDSRSKPIVNGENITSASTTNDLDKFTQNLHDGAKLLKQARECLRNEAEEVKAEVILHKCTELLSAAVALKPMSLLAVGQLGNTLLLHGELKLKISREIRTLLSRNDLLEDGKELGQHFDRSNTSLSKDKIVSVLVDVCEECEDLLVEAGRNYKTALSIDGSDIRSLYNWGLALYFRAELIADVGPASAFEADKIYLASIDKFAAMASRNNPHASDALYRWGLALQQRSNLRQGNSKQKVKLLQQAKSLFEEVLSSDSNNRPVREALFSCLSDMEYKHAQVAAAWSLYTSLTRRPPDLAFNNSREMIGERSTRKWHSRFEW